MYRDSIEDEGGGEAVTEAVTGAVTEEEEDTAPTGAPAAGMLSQVLIRCTQLTRPDSGRGRGF